MSSLDKTFCASPNCINLCGRKISDEHRLAAIEAGRYLSYGYFCGINVEDWEVKQAGDNIREKYRWAIDKLK
jgi:hypothetical protein